MILTPSVYIYQVVGDHPRATTSLAVACGTDRIIHAVMYSDGRVVRSEEIITISPQVWTI